jgi:uncharacterized protein (UPF0335 family)
MTNMLSGDQVMGFVERVERLEERKREIIDDIRAVYAEAKACGFLPKYIRKVVKRRGEKPGDVQEDEALTDLYMHAAGLALEAPLFRHVGAMKVDRAAREQVIEAFKALVPNEGEIIVKMGGAPVRLWRDKDGAAHAEDFEERLPEPASDVQRPRGARAAKAPPPAVDEAGAHALGGQAARDNQPIIANPFPWDDRRRAHWDKGWRDAAGTDGMGKP